MGEAVDGLIQTIGPVFNGPRTAVVMRYRGMPAAASSAAFSRRPRDRARRSMTSLTRRIAAAASSPHTAPNAIQPTAPTASIAASSLLAEEQVAATPMTGWGSGPDGVTMNDRGTGHGARLRRWPE